MPKPPHQSIWNTKPPGMFKRMTRFMSKPGTSRARISNLLRWKFRGQWKVGEDRDGNEYYLYQPFPETPIRRFCIFRFGQTSMDDIPFLWYQWIRYQRNYPPTISELDEYDEYLRTTQEKAAKINARDDQLRLENPQHYEDQKKRIQEVQEEMTNRAQTEVIELFKSRENALRLAAENKVAKMKKADDIIQSERRQYEELQFEKMKDSYADPSSVEPKPAQEPVEEQTQGKPEMFKPGAWRPWQDDDEDEEETDERTQSQK